MSAPVFFLVAVAREQQGHEGAGSRRARSESGCTHAARSVVVGAGLLLQCLVLIAVVSGCLHALAPVSDRVDLQQLPVEMVRRYR